MVPVRWYHGTFRLDGRMLQVPVARGCPPLRVRLDRGLPYPPGQVRSVTLLFDGGRLWVDVTAEVPVTAYPPGREPDPGRVAGVDLGIIHPYAVAGPGADGLLVSGRAVRAEHRQHHYDAKARPPAAARRAPAPGQRGARRGPPAPPPPGPGEGRPPRPGPPAPHQAPPHRPPTGPAPPGATPAPACPRRVPNPAGRVFTCPHCQFHGHRDLVAAASIAARLGGGITPAIVPAGVTHRRAGKHLPGVSPARRDPRRRPHHGRARGSPGRHRPAPTAPTRDRRGVARPTARTP